MCAVTVGAWLVATSLLTPVTEALVVPLLIVIEEGTVSAVVSFDESEATKSPCGAWLSDSVIVTSCTPPTTMLGVIVIPIVAGVKVRLADLAV